MANMLRPIVILLLLVSLSPAARVAGAQPPTPASVEYRVKAALIYNFAKFVEWPDAVSAGDPFIIGVLGQDPFGAALDVLQGRTVSGKRVIVKRFETLDALERSDILFISSSEHDNLADILDAVSGDAVLTVGETELFAETGGVIGLVNQQTTIRLQINFGASQRSGLQISSKLLELAKIVESRQINDVKRR